MACFKPIQRNIFSSLQFHSMLHIVLKMSLTSVNLQLHMAFSPTWQRLLNFPPITIIELISSCYRVLYGNSLPMLMYIPSIYSIFQNYNHCCMISMSKKGLLLAFSRRPLNKGTRVIVVYFQ